MELTMNRAVAFLASILLLCLAIPAAAQTTPRAAKEQVQDPARIAAAKRCKENRGSDCESAEGLKEWLREDRPITPEEQQAAAGARRHREECARNKKAPGCQP
jgi:hypothetical protein